MRFDFLANTFAAGDNGLRSSGLIDNKFSTFALDDCAQRLDAASAELFSVLPNALLQRIYRTDLADASAAANSIAALAWQVLVSGKPAVENAQAISLLAVGVRDPLLPGYPGVLIFRRNAGNPLFTTRDIDAAVEQARAIERRLPNRKAADGRCGVFLVDAKLKSLMHTCGPESLDSQLRTHLLEDAKSRFGKRPRRTASRVRLRDSRSVAQNFRVELRRKVSYADGPVLAYTLTPTIADWTQLDEAVFAGTPEIARLVPALKFMIAKYASLPGLTQISGKAKLSPYHFHREFSTLLGISPKHVMLDCQVESAGRQLQQGGIDLVDIARSCGFAHQSHFTSRFKQATGLTPTGWRKAMRNGSA